MIFNGVAVIPRLVTQYKLAKIAGPIADDLAKYARNVNSNPKCRQIEAGQRAVQKAVPAIMEYFADPDDHASHVCY